MNATNWFLLFLFGNLISNSAPNKCSKIYETCLKEATSKQKNIMHISQAESIKIKRKSCENTFKDCLFETDHQKQEIKKHNKYNKNQKRHSKELDRSNEKNT